MSNSFNSEFNIGFHVYCGSNITKLNLQCASLLTSSNNIDENTKIDILQNTFNLIESLKLKFDTIDEAINYLTSKGFNKINIPNILNKIHVVFYCDSTSGYKYSGLQDFKNRFDIPQFRELFENRMFNFIGKLKKLPYFIYYFHPLLFPEINNIAEKLFNLYDDVFEHELTYENYSNDNYINNIFNEKCKKYFGDDFNIPKNENEFNNINFIISQNVREFTLPLTFTQFKMIFRKNEELNLNDYSKIIDDILKKEYPNGIKLTYQTFLELYELQPELFDDEIEKYFDENLNSLNENTNILNENTLTNTINENTNSNLINSSLNENSNSSLNENSNSNSSTNTNSLNENSNSNTLNENENSNTIPHFKNYNPNIINVKKIYNEFHKLYSNSSFQGTKYHTNLMINRNQFLNDYDSKHKIFIDDDDFTCGLEHYYYIYQLYNNFINNNWLTIKNKILEICFKFKNEYPELKTLKYELLNNNYNNNVLEFRKIMKKYLSPNENYNIVKRLIYSIYMKMNMYNFPTMCMNFNNNKLDKCLCVCADWSKIMPPYMPINFIMVNDTLCEDVMFSKINFTQMNYFDIKKPIYYYFVAAHANHWGTWENCSWFERIHILSYLNLIQPNYFKYTFVNIGRYYYKYDSIVEFENCESKTELRFVTSKNNLNNENILIENIINKFYNIDKWNEKLSNECLKHDLLLNDVIKK
jgi:hypothetical protein